MYKYNITLIYKYITSQAMSHLIFCQSVMWSCNKDSCLLGAPEVQLASEELDPPAPPSWSKGYRKLERAGPEPIFTLNRILAEIGHCDFRVQIGSGPARSDFL